MAVELPQRAEEGWQSVRRMRYSAATPRVLASAALALFFALGVRSALFPAGPAEIQTVQEPSADAPSRAFALQFARAYLTYDAAHPGRRTLALAPYLHGTELPSDAGLSAPRGIQKVEWVDIASDQRALAGGRLLTVAAGVSTQDLPLYLAINVRHQFGDAVELLGYPSLVGAPLIDSTPPAPRESVTAPGLLEVIERVVRNYLSGASADLRADLVPGAEVTLPTVELHLSEVQSVQWLGEANSTAVLVTVSAIGAAAQTYTLSYELGISNRDRPYVTYIEVIPSAG